MYRFGRNNNPDRSNSVEKNGNLGRMPRNYWKHLRRDVLGPASKQWERWAEENLSGDEGGAGGQATELRVYEWSKKSYQFEKNNDSEPILPEDTTDRDVDI